MCLVKGNLPILSILMILFFRTSLEGQWLRLRASTAGAGSIPGQGTKIPHALQPKKKKKDTIIPSVTKKQFCREVL